MLGYLKKFNNLPAELREKVSNRAAMATIEGLEKKFELPLASFIMRVAVKEIAFKDLASYLSRENLTETAAGQLAEELKEKVFFSLGDYLSLPAPAAALSSREELSGELKPSPRARATTKPSDRPLGGASFFFSPDDETEIRELAKKIGLTEKIALPAAKVEENLEAIINRAQINFGSADLADRFRQILKTYFRGIRNKLETELTLTKPFLSGGLSFDTDSAQKVMAMADRIVHPVKSQSEIGTQSVFNGVNPVKSGEAGTVAQRAGQTIKPSSRIPGLEKSAENKSTVVRDAPYDFSKLAKEEKISALVRPSGTSADAPAMADKPADQSAYLETAAGKKVDSFAPLSRAAEAGQAKRSEATQPKVDRLRAREARPELAPLTSAGRPAGQAGNTSQMPLIRLRFQAENLSPSQKVKVEDVKHVPRVMSPLDEIKYLDLINFRRLDKDPQRAIDKIKVKMSLLEEEGYGKKLEGIKLWRSSPVNRLYLEIGHLSISENRPVDVIIEERKIKAGDYLTAAEFEAIMDLNKSLRF